jgi:pimeloyl-ACP methyl ester carboxylesterase
MTKAPLVFFIHGLNTFGDDIIHTGPLTFGPMYKHWKPSLEAVGCEVHSLKEMGYGPIDDQVDRAMRQVDRIIRATSANARNVHLLGHSMGGLVARGVAKRVKSELSELARIRSVITIGSPHFGSRAADNALELPEKSPRLHRFLKLLGYNVTKKFEHILPLQLKSVLEFNERHPALEGVDNVSLVGAARFHQVGVPYMVIYKTLHESGKNEQSDGLVMSDSQRWARIAGEFELDHLAQLGSFALLAPFARVHARRELARAVQTVQDIIKANSQD